jgi:hypothetical protein
MNVYVLFRQSPKKSNAELAIGVTAAVTVYISKSIEKIRSIFDSNVSTIQRSPSRKTDSRLTSAEILHQ